MYFSLKISRTNLANSYYEVDLFPEQSLNYDIEFYDTINIDKIKLPFYTELKIPLTERNQGTNLFNFNPNLSPSYNFPSNDFYFKVEIEGTSNTINGLLTVNTIEYNSAEPYIEVGLKDFISSYLSKIKDVPLGDIYTDVYYTSRHTFTEFLTPTGSGGEAGLINTNPDYSRPISFPYVDFVNDVKGKFNYAARQFVEYGPDMTRAGIVPAFSVKGFLDYLSSYINDANFPFRIDSKLLGVGAFAGNPQFANMQPEKIHMLLPSRLLAKQDVNTRKFTVRQAPAWVGTNSNLNRCENLSQSDKLFSTNYFSDSETSGNYGTTAGGGPAYPGTQEWAAEERNGFYPEDDEPVRGFLAPKVAFNSEISLANGKTFVIINDAEYEIPVIEEDKMVHILYAANPNTTIAFNVHVSIFEEGFEVKRFTMNDAQGDTLVVDYSNIVSTKTGYSNKSGAAGPIFHYFDCRDGNPTIMSSFITSLDTLVFEPIEAHFPQGEELFINSGSRYSINYWLEPISGNIEVSYVTGFDNANPHESNGYLQATFSYEDILKGITRFGDPDGATGNYGELNIKFEAKEDFLPYKKSDEFIIQESINKTCSYNVYDVLLGIAKRFDCGLYYDYDSSVPQNILRIDPLHIARGGALNIDKYVDDLNSFKISNGGDRVKSLIITNKDFDLYYDDIDDDGVTVGSTTQEINQDGIVEIKIDLNSSIYENSVCGDVSTGYDDNQNYQNGAFSANDLGLTPNVFTQNTKVGFRFAYLDKPLYQSNLLVPYTVLKGMNTSGKMITEVERIYSNSQYGVTSQNLGGKHIFNGRLFSENPLGWSLKFEDENGSVTDTYTNIFANADKINQSERPTIEFDMVVPVSELGSLDFFLSQFNSSRINTSSSIYVKSAKGEVYQEYAYLTIEGLLI
jgi:hypothetical protein